MPARSSNSAGHPPRSAVALLGGLLLLVQPLAAHDHWIAPSSFHPAAGERVDLFLRVGHPSQFEEQIRDPRRFVRFEDVGSFGARPIVGVDGKSPAGLLRPQDEGVHVLVFQSNFAFVEIEAALYAEYLKTEGLEDVQAEREQRGEGKLPGRDSYARCDKALVRVGDLQDPAGFDRTVGLPLELVLETNPFTWKKGDTLAVRLEFGGQPLANRQVKLMSLEAPHRILLARTDASGRARFTPEQTGGWVFSSVHQRRATPEQKLEGNWDGQWASLAFELGPRNRKDAE